MRDDCGMDAQFVPNNPAPDSLSHETLLFWEHDYYTPPGAYSLNPFARACQNRKDVWGSGHAGGVSDCAHRRRAAHGAPALLLASLPQFLQKKFSPASPATCQRCACARENMCAVPAPPRTPRPESRTANPKRIIKRESTQRRGSKDPQLPH